MFLHNLPLSLDCTWSGMFMPYDLSVRFNWDASELRRSDDRTRTAMMGTTFAHECHHYRTVIGTTWGLAHVRHNRSWANVGAHAFKEYVVPHYRERKRKIPVPLQRASPALPQAEQRQLAVWFKEFTTYSLVLYFELGVLPPGYPHGFRTDRPQVTVHGKPFQFGTHAILEGAARTEDRLRTHDYRETRFRYSYPYDGLRLATAESGIRSPLAMLAAIDIALNPVIPLPNFDDPNPSARFGPYRDVDAAWRYARIIEFFSRLQGDKTLPSAPDGPNGFWNRDELDAYYETMLALVKRELGFASPTEALEELSQEEWDPLGGFGVTPAHIQLAIEVRRANPSAVAFQTLTSPPTGFEQQMPPYFIIFTNGGLSTIKDERLGTLENLAIMRRAVVEQLVSDNGHAAFICPFCRNPLPKQRHTCQWGETFAGMAGIQPNHLFWTWR